MKNDFKQLSLVEVTEYFASVGVPKFRVTQVLEWVYGKHVNNYSSMSNLPKDLREKLALDLPLTSPETLSRQVSKDGSRKYVLEFPDGALCEAVGMPSKDGRLSVCISSQSGCAMACSFCATGMQGLTRSLYPGEFADQVMAVQEDFGERVTNVVVMGQGEPFANFTNTVEALRILNHPRLFNIGARHITVSTCGLVEGIRKFAQIDEQFTLAVSLHSAVQDVRDALMPTMKEQRLGTLRKALVDYTEATGRRFSFEYALMLGVNDGKEDLLALAEYCKRILCHVNLIPLNHIEGSEYKPVSASTMHEWCAYLNDHGVTATVRNSRGADIDAACGQLAASLKRAQ